MNYPYKFALATDTNPVGRLFDYSTASIKNLTIESISAAAGLGGSAAVRLATAGIKFPPAAARFWITGFSLTAQFAGDIQPKVSIGLYDTGNSVFIPFYECLSAVLNGGGIQKTFGKEETGLYLPASATLLPAIQVATMSATDGDVVVSGDISTYVERT